jgi:excisionase family DNA binding protein
MSTSSKMLPPAKTWLTVPEAAQRMRCCPRTVRNRLYRGDLRAYKPTGRLLLRIQDVDEFILGHPANAECGHKRDEETDAQQTT